VARRSPRRTEGRYDVARVHGIFVLDEPKSVHELDFGNLASAMSRKVTLDILLGDSLGQVAQVQSGCRYLSHDCN
jgi:hypothetical protein